MSPLQLRQAYLRVHETKGGAEYTPLDHYKSKRALAQGSEPAEGALAIPF
ncbi:predicted protein [Plenodomus lingam JN3]|uniref:Predicted protein n=2 Tax=Leptosphaeria maculans TaxID=5022 RepID=E4ZQG4_LEPMJ|nr:predicted protein [Plenodomus lingam JN3]CBX93639.1 predicted protein [Plenodomus lingam JN3]